MRRVLGVCLLVLSVVGACADKSDGLSAGSTDTEASSDFDGYFADNGTSTVFIQWNERDGDLTGTASFASLTDDGLSVERKSAAFEGFVEGDDVTITFAQGFGLSTNWLGKLHGDDLEVTYNDAEGALKRFTTSKADLTEFEQAVEGLETIATGAADAAAEQAEHDAQEAIDQENADNEAAAAARLAQQISDLKGAIRDGLADAHTSYESVEESLDLVRQDAAVEPMDSYQADSVGFSTDSVGFARDDVGYVLDGIEDNYAELQSVGPQADVAEVQGLVDEARGVLDAAEAAVTEARNIADDARARAS